MKTKLDLANDRIFLLGMRVVAQEKIIRKLAAHLKIQTEPNKIGVWIPVSTLTHQIDLVMASRAKPAKGHPLPEGWKYVFFKGEL